MILRTLSRDGKESKNIQPEINNNQFCLLNDKGSCEYQNFTSVQKIPEAGFQSTQIKVSNKLCKQNGQFMEKVTLIRFNNELITIKDRYLFLAQPQPNIDSNSQKRIHIFKKPLHIQNKSERKKRVTKNLPKNFIKAFLNYLQSVKNEKSVQLLKCKMKLFSSRQKYNNSFIQKIIDDPDLGSYFLDFLNSHAKDWIQNSKIRDKDVHFEAIQVFKRLSAVRGDKKQEGFDSFLSSFSDESQRISSNSKQQNQSDKQSIIANSSKNQSEGIQQQ